MNKKNIIECFCIVFVLFLLLLLIIAPFLPVEEWIIINQYKKDKFVLEQIAIDLFSINSEHIYIGEDYISINNLSDSINPKSFLYDNNDALKKYINSLLQKKEYLYIEKFEDCIFFCKKASFGKGIGVCYTLKNKKPTSNSGDIMYIKQISDNWFYYELD